MYEHKIRQDVIYIILFIIAITAGSLHAAVYYVAPTGNDNYPGTEAQPWLTIQKAADTMVAGDMVYIKAGTYNEQVNPVNSGAPASYITYSAYPGHTVTIDGTGITLPAYSGLFNVQSREYIRIAGLRLINASSDLSNAGILVDNCNHIIIENNYTYNTISSSIGVWNTSYVTVAGNEVQSCCHGGQQECISIGGCSNFEVKYNHVHHGNTGANAKEGICIKDGSNNGKVFRNNVHDMNKVAFYVDAWDKHTYNIDIYQNIVHDNANVQGFALASEMEGLLENINVYNNLIYNNGYNGLVFGDWGGPVPTHPLNNIKVINNTMYGNGTSGWGGGIAMDNQWATNVTIRNNIVSQNTSFTIVVGASVPTLVIDYNLIDGFLNYPGETRGTNYQEGNPLFQNPTAGDFHIQLGSPAIDHATSSSAPAVDYDTNSRPQGTAYDIGAYEFVVSAPDISATPSPVQYGNVLVGNNSDRTVTVRNSGTANLSISSETNPASPFSIITNNCNVIVLLPGGTCTMAMRFAPGGAGSFTGSFSILSNAANKATYPVELKGVGVTFMMNGSSIVVLDGNNGLWEPGETVVLAPSWTNTSATNANSVTATAITTDPAISLENSASYGNIPAGATVACTATGNCYGACAAGARPQTHWDTTISETLSTTHVKDWVLHIGSSFADIVISDPFYLYIEKLLHSGVTAGCDATHYCPANTITRDQMAKFICGSMEKKTPGSCSIISCTGIFSDVQSSNMFCPYVEALYNAGVVNGCQSSPLLYCPSVNTQRQAMAKFICQGMNAASPGSCTATACAGTFNDVTSSNPFCPFIEGIYNAGIVTGCQSAPLLYCPVNNVTRSQMAKYLVNAFNLSF